jgi:hypothetical protein
MELEEREPDILNDKDHCIQYNLSYVHSKEDYYDWIKSFEAEMNPLNFSKLETTSRFMFDMVGYGIFVFIKNGKIHTFQPFANIFEMKPSTTKLTSKDTEELYQNKTIDLNIHKKKFYHRIVKERREWVISGCNFFYWEDWWKDLELYIQIYYDMLKHLIGDITTCFFINLFDLPILNKIECEQFLGEDASERFIPVLSACTSPEHYDTLNIYPDAWEVVSQKKFGTQCRSLYFDKKSGLNTTWETKENKIVFRGRNTSCYPNDFERNIRLKVSKLAEDIIKEADNKVKIDIDIGINDITTSTLYHDDILDYSKPTEIFKPTGIPRKSGIPMLEQSNSKYILDMDGFVTPWRLCYELSYNSCIILVRSHYISWFYHELEHGNNIYMINQNGNVKKELTDALLHFSKHDDEGQRIASSSLELYNKIMNVEYMRDYMRRTLDPFSLTAGKRRTHRISKRKKTKKNGNKYKE